MLLDAPAVHAVLGRDLAHHLGQVPNVAPHVLALGGKIHDRVADQLSWRVQRDVAAAARLDHIDPELSQLLT